MVFSLQDTPPSKRNLYALSSELEYPETQPTTRIVRQNEKRDNTKAKERAELNRKRHLAIGKVAYGALRFLPWFKHATDLADIIGISPDNRNGVDYTDISEISSNILKPMLKNKEIVEDFPLYKPFKGFANSMGLIGLGGDIAQEYENLKELYNLYK